MRATPPPYPPVAEMCAYVGPRGDEDMNLANALVNWKGAILWEVPSPAPGAPKDVWACGMGYVPYGGAQLMMRVHEAGAGAARRPRMGEVPADQAARLLGLAERALAYLDSVARTGTRPGATGPERAAASRSRSCLDALAPLAAPLDTVIAELRAAASEGRPAKVRADQAGAVEAYASCATALRSPPAPEPPSAGWVSAVVGIGLPALGTALVAL